MLKVLNILQVLPELNSGGVERGTVDIAKAILDEGFKSYVCSSGGVMVKELEKLGVTHIEYPLHSKNPITMLINVIRLVSIIKQHKIDIIHARSRAPAWCCWLASALTKCHFVTTFHGTYNIGHALKLFYNSVMTKGEKVIAVSNFIKKHIVIRYHCHKDKIVVINRGVDFSYFNKDKLTKARIAKMKASIDCELKGTVLLIPARFTRWKGQLYVMDALKYLKGDFTCLMVGTQPAKHHEYYKELEKRIREYKLTDKVFLRSVVKDMPALYSLSDVVISPSIEPEAFGRTITEAQAMEKLVVATNLGAPMETISNGKTGFLVSHTDPTELVVTLEKIMKMDLPKRNKITQAAYQSAKTSYSLEHMCEETIKVYRSL